MGVRRGKGAVVAVHYNLKIAVLDDTALIMNSKSSFTVVVNSGFSFIIVLSHLRSLILRSIL